MIDAAVSVANSLVALSRASANKELSDLDPDEKSMLSCELKKQ